MKALQVWNVKANGTAPLWACVVLIFMGFVSALTVIHLRPATDPLLIIGGIVTGITPTTAAILALLKSQQTHQMVNGRLDAFMAARAQTARAEGIAEGIAQEKRRAGPGLIEVALQNDQRDRMEATGNRTEATGIRNEEAIERLSHPS